jgi:catechol 2,3-dioxygenase-like lactoylglutathione lyase family enzyme
MKRLHVHLRVEDLRKSVEFYTAMFGAAPAVLKGDYAKWAVDDPPLNFAVSARGGQPGLDHLGFQFEDGAQLESATGQLRRSGLVAADQKDVACCYARGDKSWLTDPDGVAWEAFYTSGAADVYHEEAAGARSQCCPSQRDACCTPGAA